ncbi:MAG: hypothetical protein WAU70_08070 [Flavobacteriales bacterium]
MRSCYPASILLGILPFTLQAQNEVEPNDLYTQANFWPENTAITGTSCLVLGGTLDVDWYMIVPSEQGMITVTATVSNNTAGFYGISIQFFQQDGTTLYWNTSAVSNPVPYTSQTVRYCTGTDTLYVAVATGLDHCEYYTLSYAVTPPAFANDAEDNDDLANATPLAPSTWTEGRLEFAFDDGVDWYSILPPQVGRYELTVEASYQTDGTAVGGINTQLFDANGNLAANQGAQVGANTVITTENTVSCLGDVPYYLLIGSNSSVCGVAYRFKWELVPTVFGNDTEPNNTAPLANYFPPDVPQPGVPGDTDWWKLYKPYNGDLQLNVRAAFIDAGNGDFTVQVFNTAMQLLSNGGITPGQNNVPSSLLVTVPATVPDSFYIQVYNNSFDCGSYELSYASQYVGIHPQDERSGIVTVHPNPSNDAFTFRCNDARIASIMITDVEGRPVTEQEVNGLGSFMWDATGVRAGSYLARMTTVDGSTSVVRLVRTP